MGDQKKVNDNMANSNGIKPHSREERWAVVEQLIPLWKQKFGDNLLGIAVSASVARGQDNLYSDLELDVFLKEKPENQADQYLQRVVDGMLVEAIYHTPGEFISERSSIQRHWYLSASDRWNVVFNQPFFDDLLEKMDSIQHSDKDFLGAATWERYEFQESFCKVLNAVEERNVEGISLLLMDACLHVLKILAFINQEPFVTFSHFISQSRGFRIKPDRLDDFLDILVHGSYQDLDRVRGISLAVFKSMEEIFRRYGIELFDDELDPNLPNRPVLDS